MPTRVRPLWTFLAAAVVLAVPVVFVISRFSEPELLPISRSAGVTIAGQLEIDPPAPVAGATVTAKATISADRGVTLSKATVKVRDEAGTFHDFPEQANVQLNTVPREIEWSGRLPARGTYTYYLAYQLDGQWISLPPWQQVTVR